MTVDSLPEGNCRSLIWTGCTSQLVSWLHVQLEVGEWNLCIWFQCIQPYIAWWCVVSLKGRYWKWSWGCGWFQQTLSVLLKEIVGVAARRWWWEANSFSLIIIQFEFVFFHPQPNISDTIFKWTDQAWVTFRWFSVIEFVSPITNYE